VRFQWQSRHASIDADQRSLLDSGADADIYSESESVRFAGVHTVGNRHTARPIGRSPMG